jgi:outer membrane receptor for ferrienterochelin and colicins
MDLMQRKRLSITIAALLVSYGVDAQQTQPAQQPAARQEKSDPKADPKVEPNAGNKVEVTADVDSQRRNDTASKTVITHDEIVKYGDQSVLDVMKRLPGVTVNGSSVRMRGLGSYTQILVNGDRPPAGFSLDTLAPDQIEKIEVVRAATAEYSTQSIAGTVNIVLRKAVDKASREFRAGTDGSPGRHSVFSGVTLSDKVDKLSYTLGANMFHFEGGNPWRTIEQVRDPADAPTELRDTFSRNHNFFNGGNLNARLHWTLSGNDTLTWQTFVNSGRYHGTVENYTTTLRGPPYPYPDMAFATSGENESIRSDINWVARFANGSKLDTKVGLSVSDAVNNVHRLAHYNSATPVLDREYDTDSRDKGITWTGKYSIPLLTDHALAVGWDTGRSLLNQGDVQDDAPLPGIVPFDFNNSFHAAINRLALYAQDEWDLTPRWSLYLGGRWEGIETQTSGSGFEPTTSRVSVLSPLMQTLWKLPGSKDQLRLALTRTYKAPELQRLVQRRYYTSFNTAVTPDSTGNPTLRPELATGIDAAYEHYWTDGAMLSISVTSREISDLTRNVTAFDGSRWVSSPTNLGNAHVRGLEFETKFPLKSVIAEAPAIQMRVNFSRNWSSVDDVPGPDNRLDNQPRWSGNLGADYKSGPWSTGGNFSYVSGGWTRTSVNQSAYGLAQRTLEAYLAYRFDLKNQLRLSLLNMLKTGSTSVSRYEDASATRDFATYREGYLGWRLQYERKF